MCGVHAGAEESYALLEIGTIEVNLPVLPWDDTIGAGAFFFNVTFCPLYYMYYSMWTVNSGTEKAAMPVNNISTTEVK